MYKKLYLFSHSCVLLNFDFKKSVFTPTCKEANKYPPTQKKKKKSKPPKYFYSKLIPCNVIVPCYDPTIIEKLPYRSVHQHKLRCNDINH